MIPHRIRFTMAFPQIPEPVADFWGCLTDYLASEKALPAKFILSEIAGHPEHLRPRKRRPDLVLTSREIEAVIAHRGLTGFAVDTGHSERSVGFELTQHSWFGWASFNCRIAQKAKAPNDWSRLIATTLERWPSIGSWQFFLPYQAWQWEVEKHKYYELINGPFPPGYRTFEDPEYDGIGNKRTFFNISMNPGRPRPLRPEIRFCPIKFYPTAEMWLGPHFWQYAKCTKEDALAADFFIEKRDTPRCLYLKCWPEPFTRPDGEQGRMQQRLWKLFFHEEPMFGPPELMPGYQAGKI